MATGEAIYTTTSGHSGAVLVPLASSSLQYFVIKSQVHHDEIYFALRQS